MKRLLHILFLSILILSSCDSPVWRTVVLEIPKQVKLTELLGESPYYTLLYFNGERVSSLHVPRGVERLEVKVKRNFLSLFSLFPLGSYSPLSGYLEPSCKSLELCYEKGGLVTFLIDCARENPDLISQVSLRALDLKYFEFDSIDKRKLLERIERQRDSIEDLKGDKFSLSIATFLPGVFESDRLDIPSFKVEASDTEIGFSLYEGVYYYVHEDRRHLLTLIVSEEGRAYSRISEIDV